MKKILLFSLLVSTLVVTGCHHQGWRVQQGKVTVSGANGIQSVDQSILLNKATGESWVLAPEGNSFYWKKITKE